MPWTDFPAQRESIQLLQRSLERGRLGHAYLLSGNDWNELEDLAGALAKTVNCTSPPSVGEAGMATDFCGGCVDCRKVAEGGHPDVTWVRPESKLRVITVGQIHDLMHTVQMKPTEGHYKVAVLSGADRLNVESANAFLKTLEEPPARSLMILLTTEPLRVLETITSRCMRLTLAGRGRAKLTDRQMRWLEQFAESAAAAEDNGLLARYRLLDGLLQELGVMRSEIEKRLGEQWSLERYEEVDPKLQERWSQGMNAAIEAEYRRQRIDLLVGLEWWLRDVWIQSTGAGGELLSFPQLAEQTRGVAGRLTPDQAKENLDAVESTQRWLHTNAQEALVLEVGLLKLRF